MADQDQSIVIGTAFPGLADSLELKDYEATKDIDLKDYVEFGLNDDYVVYGKNEVVWLYSFTTEKEYRLTPMDENAQFIGVSNDMVFWYDVSTRGRDVVKYLLIP